MVRKGSSEEGKCVTKGGGDVVLEAVCVVRCGS